MVICFWLRFSYEESSQKYLLTSEITQLKLTGVDQKSPLKMLEKKYCYTKRIHNSEFQHHHFWEIAGGDRTKKKEKEWRKGEDSRLGTQNMAS